MTSSDASQKDQTEKFSLGLFLLTIALTVVLLGAGLYFIAPQTWHAQWHAPIWAFLAGFGVISLFNCFVEYFFHRYVLHRPLVPGFGHLYRQHTLHHALTRIGHRPSRDGRNFLSVENKFPIVEPEQGEGSFFPWFSLGAFSLLLTPLLVALQWLVPVVPWFLSGVAALTSSIILYELLHAFNHWPFEKWAPLIEHETRGRFWRLVYSFHLRHHAVIDCNESVSGFFGLPLADWTFRTCVIPPTIYTEGEAWTAENFAAPRPMPIIRWLDQYAEKVIRARRRRLGAHS